MSLIKIVSITGTKKDDKKVTFPHMIKTIHEREFDISKLPEIQKYYDDIMPIGYFAKIKYKIVK